MNPKRIGRVGHIFKIRKGRVGHIWMLNVRKSGSKSKS